MQFINTSAHRYTFVFYDKNLRPYITVKWDGSLFGGFAFRVINEALPNMGDEEVNSLYEPWFEIKPGFDEQYIRSEKPIGMTSLKGTRLQPDPKYADNLKPHPKSELRYCTFTLYDVNRIVFQGNFSVDDLFRAGAEYFAQMVLKNKSIAENDGLFFYEIVAEKRDAVTSYHSTTTILAPNLPISGIRSENVFEIPKLEKGRERLKFKKVSDEDIEVVDLTRFEQTEKLGYRGLPRRGRVIVHQHVYDSLVEKIELSMRDENGGYLLGKVYRMPDSPADEDAPDFRWVVEVTDVFKSSETFGNAVLLMFTHDSWSEIKRKIDTAYQDKKLVSWFHTHLFKATNDFGLSGLDQKLHANYFSKPWQIALLLNIEKSGKRELRCFQLDDQKRELVESTYEVLHKEVKLEPPATQ